MKNLLSLPLLAGVLALAGCASSPTPTQPPQAELPTVPSVDLARYIGSWYEVASLPNTFQSMCVSDTQARYRRDGDQIEVVNQCRKADGSLTFATAVASVVPGSGNAKLRVSFFRPFYGDYWVLALDPDYRWALVGEPKRRYGWVLSRTPVLAPADLELALRRAEELGYVRSSFKVHNTKQMGMLLRDEVPKVRINSIEAAMPGMGAKPAAPPAAAMPDAQARLKTGVTPTASSTKSTSGK